MVRHKKAVVWLRISPNANPLTVTLEPGKDNSFLYDPISIIMGINDNRKEIQVNEIKLQVTEFPREPTPVQRDTA